MSGRVLVIDDSTTLRKLVEIAMRGSGIDIDFAANGSDGVARAREVRPDAILLDFLLPDLSSAEVCQQLADDRTTSQVPIVVMSANQATVFAAFQKFPTVVSFVGKPFTPTEIRTRLEAAVNAPPVPGRGRSKASTLRPSPVTPQHALTATQLAAATKSFQEVLQPRLASLANGEASGNERLAELLLAPDIVEEIVAACGGLNTARLHVVDGDLQLRGNLMSTPLLEALRLLTSSSATGTLVIELADRYWIHLRRGGVLMCTSSRFDDEVLGSISGAVSAEALAHARRLQHAEGKPILISLAQAGVARVADLPAELHAAGGRLLGELLGTTAGRFTWSPTANLPDYVDAFGRHLSITSIALARHRQGATSDAALPPVFLDEVYDRTPRFSEKLGGARLNRDEQRLLALVDGRYTVRDILGKAEISMDRAAAIFSRLRNVDLIRTESTSIQPDLAGGAVIVVDADEDGFVGPLRAHFARRPQPIEVISPASVGELAGLMLKLRPRLVVVNTSLVSAQLVERELAPIGRAGTMALTAILDHADPTMVAAMLKAGVHAVLTKPLHINDLERMTSFQ